MFLPIQILLVCGWVPFVLFALAILVRRRRVLFVAIGITTLAALAFFLKVDDEAKLVFAEIEAVQPDYCIPQVNNPTDPCQVFVSTKAAAQTLIAPTYNAG